jgi:simple sugar transport system substrate-binding protein
MGALHKGDTLRRFSWRVAGLAVLLSIPALGSAHADPLKIVFTNHWSASDIFSQAVKRGFESACGMIKADCQMVFVQDEGSVEQQAANMQAAIARNPDILITTIVDNRAFNGILAQAKKQGIVVIAVNVDATTEPALSLREAFVGQGFIPAGEALAQAESKSFPSSGPLHIVVGVNAPGQNWSEQRAAGIIKGLDDYKAAHPDQPMTITRIDAGADPATVADRVGAYLSSHHDVTAYFDTGNNDFAVAHVLQDDGIPPKQVLLAGFDLVPQALQEIKAGYIQMQVDQQPFMQGFMSVMDGYLAKTINLAPADIDTGRALVDASQVNSVMALSKQGLR